MRKLTLCLSLLLAVTATADTFKPEVSDGSTKTFYKIRSNAYPNSYIGAQTSSETAPFKGYTDGTAALFTFEATEEEDVYYIKSEDYGAYLSHNNVAKNGSTPVKYSSSKSDTEKWKFISKSDTETAIAIVTYDHKDIANGANRYGLNTQGNATGSIVLWQTASGNGGSFYQLEVVDMGGIISEVEEKLNKCGKQFVGYPTSTSPEVQEALATAKNLPNLTNVTALQTALDNFWNNTDISNIKMPEDGKVYKISGVLANGTKRYIFVDGNTIKWTTDAVATDGSGYFICQNTADGVKMAAANGSGLISDAAGIVENGITFHFDGSKSINIGHVMLIVDANNATQYRTISVENNGGMGYYSRNLDNIYRIVNNTVSTDFEFEEVEDYTFPATITEGSTGNYGTLNLPFATTVPEGVTVNKVVASDESDYELTVTALELNEGDVLPAGTPVLLSAEAAGVYNFAPAAAQGSTPLETGLQGTLAAKAVTGAAYILALSEGEGSEIKFFLLDGTSNTVNANKAYYVPATASGVRSLALNGGMATAIEGVTATPAEAEAACFDLSGRRVTLPARGLYIVGGKKIFVK